MLATLHLELTTLLLLQGLRTPVMLATLHARDDIVRYLLLTEICDLNLQDCVSPKLIYEKRRFSFYLGKYRNKF